MFLLLALCVCAGVPVCVRRRDRTGALRLVSAFSGTQTGGKGRLSRQRCLVDGPFLSG